MHRVKLCGAACDDEALDKLPIWSTHEVIDGYAAACKIVKSGALGSGAASASPAPAPPAEARPALAPAASLEAEAKREGHEVKAPMVGS